MSSRPERRRALALAVALAAIVLGGVGCGDGDGEGGSSQGTGLEQVVDEAEDLAEGDSDAQVALCSVQPDQLVTAVEAYRLAVGDLEALPVVEDLVAEGLLDEPEELVVEISGYDPDGTPIVTPVPEGPCDR